ncbi:hypothetical protein [Pseudomonas sp. NIBRBAC000502773]
MATHRSTVLGELLVEGVLLLTEDACARQ